MLTIGITGGVATGKSAVTRRFAALGAVAFSADEAARAVLAPGGSLMAALVKAFGPEILTSAGTLDRARLGRRVFADEAARRELEKLMHPAILSLLRAQIDACRDDFPPDTVVAVEVPLLFEAHLEPWFDRILVVTAPEADQIARLRERNGLDEGEARRRLAAQQPLAEKAARADDLIRNDGSLPQLFAEVDALWRRLHSPASSV